MDPFKPKRSVSINHSVYLLLKNVRVELIAKKKKMFTLSETVKWLIGECKNKIYPTFNSEKSMDAQTAEILDKIDDKFALSNGDEFESEKEVHEYFTMETMNSMFPYSENDFTQSDLAEHAELVITNKYHCNF